MSKKVTKEEKTKGCENCNNTGLEPNVSLSEAQVCPECNGSPFGAGAKPPVTNPEPEVKDEATEEEEVEEKTKEGEEE